MFVAISLRPERNGFPFELLFSFLVLAYFFLNLANFIATEHPTASVRVNKVGGAFIVICAFCAFYAGASGLMVPESTFICFPLGKIPVVKEGYSEA